jgi:carbon storage regulator
MLVLSRRPGEEVVIAGNIRVTIIAAKGNRVRIGIAAPPSVTVNRKEIEDQRAEWVSQKAPRLRRLAGNHRSRNLHSESHHT